MTDERDAADDVDEQDTAVDATDGVDQDTTTDDQDTDDSDTVAELRTRVAEAEAETRRWKRRAAEADRASQKYKTELAGKQQKRGEDAEAPKGVSDDRVAELERQLAEKTRVANESRLRDEFYGLDKFQWQDRKVAYRLLEASDVQDEDGVVDAEALKDAADTLAKDHPYLLKTAEKPTPRGDRPTGQQPGNHRRTTATEKEAATARFPGLFASRY